MVIPLCGRFTITATLDEIASRYDLEETALPSNYRASYNVAPSQQALAVIHDGKRRRAGYMSWGLIPSWSKDANIANQTINARAETITDKPAFRESFQRRRALIVVDGFYEWMQTSYGKQPMRIIMKKRNIFSLASIYDTWMGPEGKVSSFSICTVEPNQLIAPIHSRMPAIIHPDDEDSWLDRDNRDTSALRSLLKPYAAFEMEAYPVSQVVGSTNYNSPQLILEDRSQQQTLF